MGRGGQDAADSHRRPQRPREGRARQLRASTRPRRTCRPSSRHSGSSVSGCGAPSVTTIRSTSGRKILTTVWPHFSPRCRSAAAARPMMGKQLITINPGRQSRSSAHPEAGRAHAPRRQVCQGGRQGRSAQGPGRLDDCPRQPLFLASDGQLGVGTAFQQGPG